MISLTLSLSSCFYNVIYRSLDRRAGSSVLVHCKMGVSRSASTVIAYAMKHYAWSLDVAYAYVKVSAQGQEIASLPRLRCAHENIVFFFRNAGVSSSPMKGFASSWWSMRAFYAPCASSSLLNLFYPFILSFHSSVSDLPLLSRRESNSWGRKLKGRNENHLIPSPPVEVCLHVYIYSSFP